MLVINRAIRLLIFSSILLMMPGCLAIQDSKMAIYYHNLTSHYNIYFNGYQKYLEVVEQTESNFVDDYSGILNVLRYPDENQAKSNSSNGDEILKKCSKILEKHKTSKWIDDTYLLIAKSYFYKGEYYTAIESFQFIANEYKNSDIAFESMIWLAMCSYQLEKYDDAQALISHAKSQQNFPEKYVKELLLAKAFIDIKQEDYRSAIDYLNQAITKEKKKDYKTRYLFIVGQLYQKIGNFPKAIENYEKVIKRNPPYEMAFNSRIEISHCYVITDEKSAKPIISLLNNMLKDDKNIQYQDQIYFELAMIELKLGRSKNAEDYFKLSLKYNKSNDNQKAISFLKLADYYYIKQNYAFAKNYYDSCQLYLNKNYANYAELTAKNKTIAELLKYLVTAETEDSLQFLAILPEKSRDSIIGLAYERELAIKREAELAEQQKKLQEEAEMKQSRDMLQNRNRSFMQPPGMSEDLSISSKWYFYNQSAMNLGKSEFNVRWGKRKLEDNWRRSQKSGSGVDMEVEQDTTDEIESIVAVLTTEEQKLIDEKFKAIPKEKQKYYTNIPFTESQMDASQKREMEGLKRAGDIFLETLGDTSNAIKMYLELLKQYPECKYAGQIHYSLYQIYDSQKDAKNRDLQKDIILTKFAESEYALLVKDPDFFKKQFKAQSKDILELYSSTYELYAAGKCDQVIANVALSNKTYPGNFKKANFDYLKLLCEGKSLPKDQFIKKLTDFQTKCKNKELAANAANLIAYLKGEYEITEASKTKASKVDSFMLTSPYKLNDNSTYIYVLFFDNRKVNTGSLKSAFSDYNGEYFRLDKLQVSTVIFDGEKQILVVKEFATKEKALTFYTGVKNDQAFLTKIKTTSPQSAIITQENFTILLNQKDALPYIAFFKKYYLK